MVLDAALLIIQHNKVKIKRKMEKYKEGNTTIPYTFV